MPTNKHKNYCHERDCEKFEMIEWKGEFIPCWYCELHKNKEKKK